jgi:four helix bundle protein
MSRAGRPLAGRYATLDIGQPKSWKGGMNDPEGIMHTTARGKELTAHSTALQAAGIALQLVLRVPAPLRSLADQTIRAATSVAANLSEGHGRCGRDRLHHWRIAYASAKEVDTFLRLLVNANAIDRTPALQAIELFDEVRAMTWRLLHPQP